MRRLLPLVVCLSAALASSIIVQGQARRPAPIPLSASQVFKKASPAVVTIETADAGGSGVIVDATGIVVTNLHVVSGAEKAMVTLANGDVYDDVSVIDFAAANLEARDSNQATSLIE